MKQYIDFIEKTVRERCPELQELSFGCGINKPHLPFLTGYVTAVDRHTVYVRYGVSSVEEADDIFQTWEIKPEEILGHEIQLQHILRTMGGNYAVAGDGQFLHMYGEWLPFYDDFMKTPIFNLSLSWKEQEEPVLKFLSETLGFNQ